MDVTATTITTRLIGVKDKDAYCQIVRDSITDNATAFYSSPEDRIIDSNLISKVINSLDAGNFRIGAFKEDKLIGIICFKRDHRLKLQHKGEIFGFFVYPEFRSQGTGQLLLEETILRTRQLEGLEKINLSVMEPGKSAFSLYKKFGFVVNGRESQSMKVEGQYVQEIFMELRLI